MTCKIKLKKISFCVLLLAAVMLCGCSGSSRENELQSQIDELRSQLENPGADSSSTNGSAAESTDNSQAISGGDKNAVIDRVYDGMDWDKIPEAPASDFGYCVFYGFYAEDPDMMAGYSGDGSEFVRSIFIFDYYGHDKIVKIPKEIDGFPVTAIGGDFSKVGGHRKFPWDPNSEWVSINCDESVFKGSSVENVFIPENLTYINPAAFDDCPTLRSISADSNNLAYFSEDGVLFMDYDAIYNSTSYYKAVYTKLPKYLYSDNALPKVRIEDEGEWVWKTPSCELRDCYIDNSFEKTGFKLSDESNNNFGVVVKFTDGTYGVLDRVTGKYLPIDKSQFKRSTFPYLYRYPEGKSDKSYTIKKRDWISVDKNGDEHVQEGFVNLRNPIEYMISTAFTSAKHLKEIKFEEGVASVAGVMYPNPNGHEGIYDAIAVEKITIPSSLVSMGSEMRDEGYYNTMFGGVGKSERIQCR